VTQINSSVGFSCASPKLLSICRRPIVEFDAHGIFRARAGKKPPVAATRPTTMGSMHDYPNDFRCGAGY
jgi:hypothetical protein